MSKEGLYYHISKKKRPVGRGKSKNTILLTVEIEDGEYTIRNYHNGRKVEAYRSTGKDQAVVDMTALLSGFQPPRRLEMRDIPSH